MAEYVVQRATKEDKPTGRIHLAGQCATHCGRRCDDGSWNFLVAHAGELTADELATVTCPQCLEVKHTQTSEVAS
jgi:hypothetical protein